MSGPMRFHFRPERSQWENVRDAKMATLDDQLDNEMQSKMGVSIGIVADGKKAPKKRQMTKNEKR
jgi:hypothetical protein